MSKDKKFDHGGHSFELRAVNDQDGLRVQVFIDGTPNPLSGDANHEVLQDANHQGIGDLRQVIFDALERHIKDNI